MSILTPDDSCASVGATLTLRVFVSLAVEMCGWIALCLDPSAASKAPAIGPQTAEAKRAHSPDVLIPKYTFEHHLNHTNVK